jgi:hypothetical protein
MSSQTGVARLPGAGHDPGETADLTIVDQQGRVQQLLGLFIGVENAAQQILDEANKLQPLANIPIQRPEVGIQLAGIAFDRGQSLLVDPAILQFGEQGLQFG